MALQLIHHKFTVDDYHRMAETGILTEEAHVELIEGELITRVAFGGTHIRCVGMLTRLLVLAAGPDFFISPQGSVRLSQYSEPEPDLAILHAPPAGSSPPPVEDVAFLIEVADTSLLYDLNIKVPLYARAGIPELWVVDLTSARVIRHTAPERGRYTIVEQYVRGERITSATAPPISVAVDDIFA